MATLQLKGLNKRGSQAIYTGLRTAVRFAVANFPNKQPAQTILIEGDVLEASAKGEKRARGKLTLAEKVKRAEQKAAKLKQQLEAEAAQEPALTM